MLFIKVWTTEKDKVSAPSEEIPMSADIVEERGKKQSDVDIAQVCTKRTDHEPKNGARETEDWGH